eukprot:COSAG01_NODE_902_length_12849_cov_26.940706_9_plen_282_part_00
MMMRRATAVLAIAAATTAALYYIIFELMRSRSGGSFTLATTVHITSTSRKYHRTSIHPHQPPAAAALALASAAVHELHGSVRYQQYTYQRQGTMPPIPAAFLAEELSVYSPEGEFVQNATTWQVHTTGLFHRDVQCVVIDEVGRVLLARRSSAKWVFPSVWDVGISETVDFGETFEQAILRGLYEELGLDLHVSARVRHVLRENSSVKGGGRKGLAASGSGLRVVEWRKDVAVQRFCWRGIMPYMDLEDCQLGEESIVSSIAGIMGSLAHQCVLLPGPRCG